MREGTRKGAQPSQPLYPEGNLPIDMAGGTDSLLFMNENDVTKIVADALRDAWRRNTYSSQSLLERNAVTSTLEDTAIALTDRLWNRSEESPLMPEEWAAAIKGE